MLVAYQSTAAVGHNRPQRIPILFPTCTQCRQQCMTDSRMRRQLFGSSDVPERVFAEGLGSDIGIMPTTVRPQVVNCWKCPKPGRVGLRAVLPNSEARR